jgi:hypothetical protein
MPAGNDTGKLALHSDDWVLCRVAKRVKIGRSKLDTNGLPNSGGRGLRLLAAPGGQYELLEVLVIGAFVQLFDAP